LLLLQLWQLLGALGSFCILVRVHVGASEEHEQMVGAWRSPLL
jgi:hypothetical protein